ncbi:MAG: hypothetical protein Q8M07_05130 [Prosthecobacter sp.]|nr:hypothetical protein [Prosthecobacter sp.]
MIPAAEALWTRLLALLREQGRMPLRSEPLTPHEIALHCHETDGDDRVRRFVDGFYYPARFGQTTGSLSEAEARALLDSFEKRAATAGDDTHGKSAHRPLCQICQHRPVSGTPA